MFYNYSKFKYLYIIFINVYQKVFEKKYNYKMINMTNVVKIAKMDEEKRKEEMSKVFGKILKEKEEKQLKALEEMIKDMKEATDNEYIDLCLTNLGISASLPDDQLKAFVAIRMKANSELPDDIKSRDMKMLSTALGKAPENVKTRISAFMPKN